MASKAKIKDKKKDTYTAVPEKRYGYAGYEIEPKGKRPQKTLGVASGTAKIVKGRKFQYIETVDSPKMKDAVVKELKRNGYIPYYTRTRENGQWVYHIYYKRGAY
ncbi:hypothetical protein KJ662_05570 [Patescibacteria group bacterium]|nr:hypothetical protein [Patescibacteria group bacterium]